MACLFLGGLSAACGTGVASQDASPDGMDTSADRADVQVSTPPRGHAWVIFGSDTVVVELARTADERAQGLMYREDVPEGTGMLFIFEKQEVQRFWMENTLIPLDMIFIDRDLKIAGIIENAEPMTKTSRFVDAPSIYVLEVNGGWSRKHAVGAGATVRFENIEL